MKTIEEQVKNITFYLEDLTRAGDVEGLEEYLEDAPEIGYVVDGSGSLQGAIIYVVLNGPTISIDTYSGRVFGTSGTEDASALLIQDVCNFINDEFVSVLYGG